MRVLGVETSTLAGGVALLDDERVVGEYLLDISLTHSERLMVAIDRVLGDARWDLGDVDALAVAVGPGSFTGLRIGLGTVKGLALARALPIAAVPTLDAMAAGLPFAAFPVCPVIAARKDEVYTSLYRWSGAEMCREWEYLALRPDELAARLSEATIVLGAAGRTVRSPHARPAPAARRGPSAACVAQLGLERARRGETVDAGQLLPLYLRPSEAEVKHRGVAVA
ncbi:MAG: tRNA (adenosine(37)-N6)-threonylcarbamoyltransferase complex dimerization subunit type 1 TsaB [Candidatus Rokuibacteriota bacterium]|nr:MAG: tRNA (adenosine(37)-N6)-threonylcarbamoyltransferase complex dimerization subunit type 1 TsaB [Candidatus Rokubacteria bacterium]